ncbi:MAG: SRPBCC domain-containing protein [Phycisphaerales bacterium JB043]
MATTTQEPTVDQFHIQMERTFGVDSARLFEAITGEIDAWWFGCSHEGATMKIEPFVGGRFYEDAGDGRGVLWAHVADYFPGQKLILIGPIGVRKPCQSVVTFEFEDVDGGCVLRFRHRGAGLMDADYEKDFEGGWNELLDSLAKHVGG